MSAELSNKVNQLCQKVKNLSKRETSVTKKEYLFAEINFNLVSIVTVDANDNIPYDVTLESNCITLNSSGGAVVSSNGAYNISFSTHPNFVGPAVLAVAVNGIVKNGTRTYNDDSTTTIAQLTNSVILNLQAGDIVTIVNITKDSNGDPVPISLTGKNIDNIMDTNLSIHKI